MELLYIWIEDYKNIKKQGFNFSPKWWFDYNSENGQLQVEDRRKKAFDGFFGEEIINITAIVGKNGSGKTSLLDYIWSNIKDGISLTHWTARMIVMYLDTEDNITVLYHSNIEKPNYEGKIDFNFRSFPKDSDKLFLPLNQVQFIYYSDVFDSVKPGSRSWDLTTSGLITRAWEDYSYRLNDMGYERVFKNFLQSYQIIEYQQQIKFAINFKKGTIPFNLPDVIVIAVIHSTTIKTKYIKELSFNIEIPLYDFYKLYKRKNFLFSLKWTIFLSVIDFTVGSNWWVVEQSLKEIIEDLKGGEFLFEKWIKKILAKHNTFKSISEHSNVLDIVDFFEKYLENNSNIDLINSEDEIRISRADWEEVSKMIDIYSNLTSHIFSHFLTFRWLELSAGERAFLKLFSRFYTQVDRYSSDNYCILIDEGTSNFHPQWQKEYLSTLIEILPKVLFDKDDDTPKKIQLLLSSHSPFVLSDLPKEHILFLDKDKEGNCQVVDGLTDKKQTFGANIHTLLTDTFFMDGLVGNFAQQKINEVIKILDNPQNSTEDLKEVEKIVNIIGEPILKRYLQKRIDSKRLKKIDKNEEKIAWLEDELEKLKNKSKND